MQEDPPKHLIAVIFPRRPASLAGAASQEPAIGEVAHQRTRAELPYGRLR